MINKNSTIFLTGDRGLVGSAIYRKLVHNGYKKIITVKKKNLDLRKQNKVYNFLKKRKPDVVIIAAGKVGGILANSTYPADFIYDNLIYRWFNESKK